VSILSGKLQHVLCVPFEYAHKAVCRAHQARSVIPPPILNC
jgi:hypothetical protein